MQGPVCSVNGGRGRLDPIIGGPVRPWAVLDHMAPYGIASDHGDGETRAPPT